MVPYLRLLALLEESVLACPVLGLVASEVFRLRHLLDLLLVHALEVDLQRGGNDVPGVDSSQRDAIDLERAGDEEDALVEGLEEDDALASESAGEEDQDGSGLQRLSCLPRTDRLPNLQ